MFGRLVMAFAARSSRAAELGGASGGGSTRKAAAKAAPPAPPTAILGALDEKDPELPAATVSMVERCRLRVDPLGELDRRVPCGPFKWRCDESIARLEITADTTAAWLYPVALGACRVTVSGGKREAEITVNVVAAVPVTLNLIADQPEPFRDLAAAGAVDTPAGDVM
jgi:hypothetical protein